jgi:hypothetical protein
MFICSSCAFATSRQREWDRHPERYGHGLTTSSERFGELDDSYEMETSSLSQEAEISQDLELSDYEQILREDLEDPDGHSEPPDDPPPEVADAPDYSEDP